MIVIKPLKDGMYFDSAESTSEAYQLIKHGFSHSAFRNIAIGGGTPADVHDLREAALRAGVKIKIKEPGE